MPDTVDDHQTVRVPDPGCAPRSVHGVAVRLRPHVQSASLRFPFERLRKLDRETAQAVPGNIADAMVRRVRPPAWVAVHQACFQARPDQRFHKTRPIERHQAGNGVQARSRAHGPAPRATPGRARYGLRWDVDCSRSVTLPAHPDCRVIDTGQRPIPCRVDRGSPGETAAPRVESPDRLMAGFRRSASTLLPPQWRATPAGQGREAIRDIAKALSVRLPALARKLPAAVRTHQGLDSVQAGNALDHRSTGDRPP